jgi:hypothetical protein
MVAPANSASLATGTGTVAVVDSGSPGASTSGTPGLASPTPAQGGGGAAEPGHASTAGSGTAAVAPGGEETATGGEPNVAGGGASGANTGGALPGGMAMAGTGGTSVGGTSVGGASNAGTGGTGETDGSAGDSGSSGADSGGATILNDTFWEDTSGTPIYSQGGGVLQVGDTYYWYGVHYSGAPQYVMDPTKNGNIGFVGITTYSSKDLVHWTHEATDKPSNAGGWFGRLGVAYNETTKKYVLVAQGGGGEYFATSDSPAGGFVYDHIQTNPPGIANGSTGDQTIFQDDDGQAYVVSSSSSGRSHRYLSPLRPSDFLDMQQAIPVYSGGGREGNCMFKYEGTYYFCSSDLHGWNTSQTYCVSATDVHGPWSDEFVLKGTEPDYSHVTQTGFFIQVYGTEQTTIIFAGDRWADFAGNGIGFNQWMPISFEGGEALFHSLSAWTIDATTGTWEVAPENNWVLNPTFEADRINVTTPVGWSATSGSNSVDGRTGRWSWNLNGTASLSQSIVDLPSGKYTLAVWAQSSGAGGELYIKNYGGDDSSVPIPATATWAQVMLDDIDISTGQAEVGVTSSGQSVKVDDFTLTVAKQ